MIYKYINDLAPQYVCDLFNSNDSIHSNNTHDSNLLRTTKSHTAYYLRSFTVSGLNLWNTIIIFVLISKIVQLYFK